MSSPSPLSPRPAEMRAQPVPRAVHFLLALMALIWAAAALAIAQRAATGLAFRFGLLPLEDALAAACFLFLFLVGTRALDRLATRGAFADDLLALPRRDTAQAEWATGAAVGWGIALAAVLPALFAGHLHAGFEGSPPVWLGVLTGLLTVALLALAIEAVFRGYAFRRLAAALGEAGAGVLLALLFAALVVLHAAPAHPVAVGLNGFLLALLLTTAWWRTHAVWTGWGMHCALRAVLSLVFGLPLLGSAVAVPMTMRAGGPRWLSGGADGIGGALALELALLLAIAVLYRATRDFAWHYTHAPIVAGGYEVEVAPPAAHAAMERAAAPPPLVQIAAQTSQQASTLLPPGASLPRPE